MIVCKICHKKISVWYRKLYDDRHGYPGYFNVVKCVSCGFAQTKPQINKNKLTALYTNYYPRQNINLKNIRPKNYVPPNKFLLWRKGLLNGCHFLVKDGSSVLDVGSGVGYSLLYLKNKRCDAYGIDPDKNAKGVAKKFKLNFHQGFIEDKPFRNKKFDYVIANQVIEHTNDPLKFLRECAKRLNPNGKIIISFPNTNSLGRILFRNNWLHWHIPYHLNHFNKKSVYELALKSGLKIEKIKAVTPNLWTNLQIRRLLLKPKMGTRDTFWDGGQKSNDPKPLKSVFFARVMKLLEEHNYLNRIIDVFGLGESYVVTLRSA